MARAKNIPLTETQKANALGAQIETGIRNVSESARKLAKFKNLVSTLQGAGIFACIFTPFTFISLVIGWIALEIVEGYAENRHKDLVQKNSKSLTLLKELLKEKKEYPSLLEQSLHYTLRKHALEQLVFQIIANKTDKELAIFGVDKNNCLSYDNRANTFTQFFGPDMAKQIFSFEKKSKDKLKNVLSENVSKEEANGIFGESITPQRTLDNQKNWVLFELSCTENLNLAAQIEGLQRETKKSTVGAQELFAEFTAALTSANINVVDLYLQSSLKEDAIVALVSNGYKLSNQEKESLIAISTGNANDANMSADLNSKDSNSNTNITNNRALFIGLTKHYYEESLEKEYVVPELEICVKQIGAQLPVKLGQNIYKSFPELNNAASNFNPTYSEGVEDNSSLSSTATLSTPNSKISVSSYGNMEFNFKNPVSQETWLQLVQNLTVLEQLLLPENIEELSAEAKFNAKNIKADTLPSLFKIYKSMNNLPESAQAVILKEVEGVMANVLDMTNSIIEEQTQKHLRQAQTLRNYSEQKKMSLGK